MIHTVDFIANHLKSDALPLVPCEAVCAFTGKPLFEGVAKKHLLSSNFTDFEYLRYVSDYVSKEAYLCMKPVRVEGLEKPIELRNYSFIVTETSIKVLSQSDFLPLLLNPPAPPFVLCVSFDVQVKTNDKGILQASVTMPTKKHASFKTQINYGRDDYVIHTGRELIEVSRAKAEEIYNLIRGWYTYKDDKKKETWFSKADILAGCSNYNRIQAYGINRYYEENERLGRCRGTGLLKLITFATLQEDEA